MTREHSGHRPLRLGVVSFAHGHVSVYCRAIAEFSDAEVVAGWDDDHERGRSKCAEFGLEWAFTLEGLLARADIDAVFVASPTNQHARHVIAAAEAGKHVLLQKPMALTLGDCGAIIDAVRRSGVKFSMCYQMRGDPVNQKMKSLLDEGAVGKVAAVRRRHAIPALLNKDWAVAGNWHIDPAQNMGMFMDDASHAADWFYWMLGRPVSVVAEIDRVVTEVAPDDNGVAIYRFGKGEMGILFNSSTQLAAEATTEIYGDAGTIHQNYGDAPSSLLAPIGPSLKLYRAGAAAWETFDYPFAPHVSRIHGIARPLVDFLKGELGPLASAEDGRVCVEMILGAYQSAREGRRVHFSR